MQFDGVLYLMQIIMNNNSIFVLAKVSMVLLTFEKALHCWPSKRCRL